MHYMKEIIKYKYAFLGFLIGFIIAFFILNFKLKECQEQNEIIKDIIIESP